MNYNPLSPMASGFVGSTRPLWVEPLNPWPSTPLSPSKVSGVFKYIMSTFDPRPSTPWIQLHAYAEACASMPNHFRMQAEGCPWVKAHPVPKSFSLTTVSGNSPPPRRNKRLSGHGAIIRGHGRSLALGLILINPFGGDLWKAIPFFKILID